MTSVLVLGVAVVDHVFVVEHIPTRPEKYVAKDAMTVGGGCAANAAVAIARLGGHALLSCRLGDDATADVILDDLKAEGVDVSLSDTSGTRSSCSTILVDANGDRQIVNFRGEGLTQSTNHLADVPEVGAILADTRWPEGAIFAMELARSRGIPGILDVEPDTDPNCLPAASHLAFSEPGLAALYPDLPIYDGLLKASETYRAWCCVTQGENGVAYVENGHVVRVGTIAVEARDTTGAGDVWHGAFALALAEGMKTEDALKFANVTAALKCARLGGRAGSPTRQEVEQELMKGTA